MLKIRRPLGRLIFNMGIAIPGKTVFLIETAPRKSCKQSIRERDWLLMYSMNDGYLLHFMPYFFCSRRNGTKTLNCSSRYAYLSDGSTKICSQRIFSRAHLPDLLVRSSYKCLTNKAQWVMFDTNQPEIRKYSNFVSIIKSPSSFSTLHWNDTDMSKLI